VNDTLMLADQHGANLDPPRRLGARFNERAKQAVGRRAQTAERQFLQPVADGPRQELL